MNPRPIKESLAAGMIEAILNKFDGAEAKDVFQLCVALGKGGSKIPSEVVSTDVFYAIYLKQLQLVKEYDLYQLSQIGTFLSSPGPSQHVPDEYWTGCFEPALSLSLQEFEQHQDVIAKDAYIDDFMSCLVPFGVRAVGSASLISQTVTLATKNLGSLSPRAIENWLFFMSRAAAPKPERIEAVQ
jgi:hypothetical protein